MHISHAGLRLFSLSLLMFALAACDTGSLDEAGSTASHADAQTDDAQEASARSVNAQLAAVRNVTAPYHDVAAAVEDGWSAPIPFECVEVPPLGGGMGYHYVNGDEMDGDLDSLRPEALLYEPQRNGRMRLVGVEYIVPFADIPAGGPAPELFGEEFHQNDDLGLWALHVWIWRNNPSGMFADFNPKVSCEFASDEE